MINDMVENDAAAKARIWSESLLHSPNADLSDVLNDQPVHADALAYLHSIARVGTILRFKIFDANGKLRFSSDYVGDIESPSLADSDPALLQSLQDGQSVTQSYYGKNIPGLPVWYAESFLPIDMGDGHKGIVEVYVDITKERSGVLDLWRWLAALFVIGGALTLAHSLTTATLYRKRQRSDAQAAHLAKFDTLTGVANRGVFNDTLHSLLQKVHEPPTQIALHLIDLDGFKTVNDLLGHSGADRLLYRVAEMIASNTRPNDLVARLGGDEFGVIQNDVRSPADAAAFAERLSQTIREVRVLANLPVDVTASIGTAIAPMDAADAINIHRCAEAALFRAKETGRDRAVLYQFGMTETVHHRNTLRLLVRQALDSERYEVYFQPVHRISDGSLASFEALLRLRDNDGNFISPAEFIPIAEEIGVMDRLGTLVLHRACHAAASWSQPLVVAVNLSAQQFSSDIVGTVKDALRVHGLPPERLILEITESLFIAEPTSVEAQLLELRALGCGISLDDFGTGYSSLSYLWMFSFDALKVDRNCFSLLGQVKNVDKILQTIANMCEAMNLDVVAEGIETDAQLAFAREAGYTLGQGFLFGRPMSGSNVEAHIAANVCSLTPYARARPRTAA